MVRFINKNLKAHNYEENEKISDILDISCFSELTQLLIFHTRNFGQYSHEKIAHLFQKLTIQQGITRSSDFSHIFHYQHTRIDKLFLTIEIILESFHDARGDFPEYFDDLISDLNDLFLIHKVPLQIRYFQGKGEFYIEKIISPEVSDKIKETLENFSEQEKVFEDFKKSIKEFSSGNYSESIKLSCKSIEDYLCIILKKQSCSSVSQYYKDASKILGIPQDLDENFTKLINYIHKHRSIDSHGRLNNVEIEDIEFVTEAIIQFTMTILNYLKKKNENTTKK